MLRNETSRKNASIQNKLYQSLNPHRGWNLCRLMMANNGQPTAWVKCFSENPRINQIKKNSSLILRFRVDNDPKKHQKIDSSLHSESLFNGFANLNDQ